MLVFPFVKNFLALGALFVAGLMTVGCSDEAAETDDDLLADEDPAADAMLDTEGEALSQAASFNPSGMAHADLCVKLAVPAAQLFFPDGRATGFVVNHSDTIFGHSKSRCLDQVRALGDRAGAAAIAADQPSGYVMVDAHELQKSDKLVFHRGGYGYVNPAVKYGHIKLAEISERDQKRIRAQVERDRADAKFGKACRPTGRTYQVLARAIPAAMQFRKSNDPVDTNSWESYGDPAAQGVAAPPSHYTYLNWTWPAQQGGAPTAGGGMARALVKDGASFRRCSVKAIKSPTYAENTRTANGAVVGVYGELNVAGEKYYGWVPYSHTFAGQTVMHIQ